MPTHMMPARTRLIPNADHLEVQAHRPQREPKILKQFARLAAIDEELAAAGGDVAKVRELLIEKQAITSDLERESEAQRQIIAESQRRREAGRPLSGEVTALRHKRRNLTARADKKSKEKDVLTRKAAMQEDHAALEAAERLEDELQDIRASIEKIDARTDEIDRWREEQRRAKALQVSDRERQKWEAQRGQNERRLAEIPNEVLTAWNALTGALAEINSLAVKLRDTSRPFFDPSETVRERIAGATDGAITSRGGAWTVTGSVEFQGEWWARG